VPISTRALTPTPTPIRIERQATPSKLVWSDEFNGSVGALPDPSKWSPDVGGSGWGNKQLEYDTDNKNAYQDGQGNLVLEARKSNPEGLKCWYGTCQYTSARTGTDGHFSFTYGRLEARIKIPYGQGIWPAFWLLGSNVATVGWPACGEIDVAEDTGSSISLNHAAIHGPNSLTKDFFSQPGNFADSFHVFALQWTPNALSFFMDGIQYGILNKVSDPQDWVFNHPFSIILNVAVGGNWPGNPDASTVFPQKMYVDYVRVYTLNSY